MRNAFVDSIFELAKKDERVVLLVGDLGFKIFDKFRKEFPDRYYNVGIAEANMIGMAAGLCLQGFKPFVYSIVPFVTLRCCEQIRNDLCYNNKDVVIVGVGGGYSYGHNGPTHHGIEDIGVLRAIPNMRILSPGDPTETSILMNQILDLKGPTYLRLGRAGEEAAYDYNPDLIIGLPHVLHHGEDLNILATGNMLPTAQKVSQMLYEECHIDCGVISVHTIKPLNENFFRELSLKSRFIVTLEEHNIVGGLGSAVAEIIAEANISVKFKRLGIKDKFVHVSGDQEFLREKEQLDVESLTNYLLENCW